MVQFHSSGACRESRDEGLIHQKAFSQCTEVRIAEAQQVTAKPIHQLRNALFRVGQKVRQLDLLGFDSIDRVQNHLQGALKELDLSSHLQEIAGIETARNAIPRVPQTCGDAARPVAKFEEQIEVAV